VVLSDGQIAAGTTLTFSTARIWPLGRLSPARKQVPGDPAITPIE
jgi:hypothetical protein